MENSQDIMDILNFTDAESLAFEKEMIHLDIMEGVRQLMGDMTRRELAGKLNASPAFVSKLFKGDNVASLELMAKLQRIFNGKFKIEFEKNCVLEVNKSPEFISRVIRTNDETEYEYEVA